MYVLGYLRLDAVLQPRHATHNLLGVNVDWLLVSLCSLSCNLSGGEVCETSAVTVTGKRQALVARPLLDDVGEAERNFAASPSDFQRRQWRDILSSQDKTHAAFVALHLHPSRRAPACVHALACHLRAYLVTDIQQDTLYLVHHAVIDYIVVSNRHFYAFLAVLSRFYFQVI